MACHAPPCRSERREGERKADRRADCPLISSLSYIRPLPPLHTHIHHTLLVAADSIVTAFTVETDSDTQEEAPRSSESDDPASSSCPPPSANALVEHSIKGIMTTRGYAVRDLLHPRRLSVWFVGGTIEPEDEGEEALSLWRTLVGVQNTSSADADADNPSGAVGANSDIAPLVGSGEDGDGGGSCSSSSSKKKKRSISKLAGFLTSRGILSSPRRGPGAKEEEPRRNGGGVKEGGDDKSSGVASKGGGMGGSMRYDQETGQISYRLFDGDRRAGPGASYVDVVYADDTLRVVRGNQGGILVFARVPES